MLRSERMTNGERIRKMTDEELAVTLMCPAEYDMAFNRREVCEGNMNRNCRQCTFDWLTAEESEE